MLPIISGTVRSAGKLMQLDNKWQQKKAEGKIFAKELTPEERLLNHFQEQLEDMKKNKEMNDISNKVMSGDTLTFEEIEYVKKNNPQLYKTYMEVRAEREAYKKDLEKCKTKEDVDRLKLNKMSSYLSEAKSITNNPNIPKGQKLALIQKILMKATNVQDVHMKFVESGKYASLPTEQELAEEAKEKAAKSETAAEELAPDEEVQEKTPESEEAQEEESAESGEAGIPEEKEVQPKAEQSAETLPEATFEEVKSELINYIKENRPSGYGLEYLSDDLKEHIKAKK